MQTEIYDVDYNDYVRLVGTAHFTKRSLYDAYEAVKRLQPTDLAIELDMKRFRILNAACWTCPRRGTCTARCEFIGATEALGNVDANIWLIDMSEHEIGQRIRQLTAPTWIFRLGLPILFQEDEMTRLWEEGFKDEVIDTYRRRLERLRERAPAVWRVLIDERNTVMAARLAWITSEKLRENAKPNILTFVGAAHVEGVKEMLSNPIIIKENLQRLGLTFTPPTLIRRISVNTD
ncbi:MAG: TraB/GumN family protein [Candidatus Bathyarchaeaceae archaeon]